MKLLLAPIFLLTFNAVQANDLFACIHLVQNSSGDALSRDIYAYVEGNNPCPSPHNFMNLYSSELKNTNSIYNADIVTNKPQNTSLVQLDNKDLKSTHVQKGHKLSLVHMVTEPDCIWFKERNVQ